jgi:TP901 family phage tail tape measure protein
MSKSHILSVTIGAALQGSFGAALSKGENQITRLGGAIKNLEGNSSRLTSFRNLKTDVGTTMSRWKSAEGQVRNLALEMARTANPTQSMQREFEKAVNTAARAKDAYFKKRDALNKVRTEMGKAGQSAQNLQGQQARLGASVTKLQSKYIALGQTIQRGEAIKAQRAHLRGQLFDMIALGAAIGAPLKAAIDFESAMADVRKVVTFKDEKNGLKNFGNVIKDMARNIPISAAGLAQIAAAGGQLGISETNLPEFVDLAAKMATAFDMLPDEAGDTMAKLSNIFNIPINEMNKLGDAINHLSDNTAAKAKDIIPVLARAGAQAKDFGLSAEQTAALADSFVALGKQPQVAGTAINALLLRLNTADKQGANFQRGLAAIGYEANDFKDSIKNDAQGALLSFLETLSVVEKQERAGILSDLFGLEYADDISLLAGNVSKYKETLALLGQEKKHNSMQREFINRSDTAANKLQLLKNSFVEIGVNIGETLIPPLKVVVDGFRSFTGIIASAVQAVPLLSSTVFGVIFSLIGLKIASIGLAYVWTFVTGGVLLVRRALLAIGIEATLAGLKFQGFNAISLVTSIRLKALAIGQRLITLWGILGNAVAFASTRLLTFNAVSLVTAGRIRLFAFGDMIKSFAIGLISLAGSAIPIVIGGLRALTVALMTNPIGLVIGGLAIAAGLIIANWDKVKSFFATIWEPVKPVWEAFANWIGNFWKIISTPFTALGKVFAFLSGSKSLETNITGTQEASGDKDKNQNILPEESSFGLNGIPPLSNIQNTQQSFANPVTPDQRATETKTINQSIKIEINAAPGQDIKSIAEEVMRKIKEISRGALFDTAGATL